MIVDILKRNEFIHGLLDFALPPLCLGCGEYNEDSSGVCSSCQDAITTIPYPICLNCTAFIANKRHCSNCGDLSFPLYAYGDYAEPLREIIIQLKFHGIVTPARLFASLINNQYGKYILKLRADFLVPVPLHPTRENYRGYNQATLLAKELSRMLELPVREDLIVRTQKRKPQAKLNLDMREKNIRSAFEILEPVEPDMKLVLVDDVVTSGATICEVKRELEKAGVKVVAAISIGKAL